MLSGQPRFTREFDDFLNSVKDYDQLNWFCLFWDSNHQEDPRIPPNWPRDPRAAQQRLKNYLPENSYIQHYEVRPTPYFDTAKKYNTTPWSVDRGIYLMYLGLEAIGQIRQQWEQQNYTHDLVIRTRPDVGIQTPLHLTRIHQLLKQHPRTVIMADQPRHGLTGHPVNDWFGIALAPVMNIYTDAFTYIDQYNSQGLPFHGETILAHHLAQNQIAIPLAGVQAVFRHYCRHGGSKYIIDSSCDPGRWDSDPQH